MASGPRSPPGPDRLSRRRRVDGCRLVSSRAPPWHADRIGAHRSAQIAQTSYIFISTVCQRHRAEFVYHMEDMLDVYTRPYDPRRPQVCLDESSVQLIGETRIPVPMAPVQPAGYDFEY